MRALIVDDAVFSRRFLVGALRSLGLEFVEAENGYAGLKLALQRNVDVIIADLNMPGLDGIQLTRQVRTKGNTDTPIFILSAGGNPDLMEQGREAGVTAWLIKPVPAAVVRSAVAKVLGIAA